MPAVHYDIKAGAPRQVSLKGFSQCIDIVKSGDAVDPESSAVEMPRAQVVVIASAGKR
jgi:hypothetical protein